jgi:hypothetical protein
MRSAAIVEPKNFKGAKKTIGDEEIKKTKKRGFHRSRQRSK